VWKFSGTKSRGKCPRENSSERCARELYGVGNFTEGDVRKMSMEKYSNPHAGLQFSTCSGYDRIIAFHQLYSAFHDPSFRGR